MATETQTDLAAVEGRLISFIGESRDVLKDELLHEIRRVETKVDTVIDRVDGLTDRVDRLEGKVDVVAAKVDQVLERLD